MQPDEFVPDPRVQKELNVTAMTIWRWDRSAEMAGLGWPPPVRFVGQRKFRSRMRLEQFKANVLQRAIQEGGSAAA